MKINRSSLSLIISGLVFVLIFSQAIQVVPVVAQQDHDDAGTGADAPGTREDAIPVEFDNTYQGDLEPDANDEFDFYQQTITDSGYYRLVINLTDFNGDSTLNVRILSSSGSEIADDFFIENDLPFYMVVPIIEPQTVYLEFTTNSDAVNYNFKPIFLDGAYNQQSDAGTPGDSDREDPKEISLNSTYSGRIGNGEVNETGLWDDRDWYQIQLPEQGYLTCDFDLFGYSSHHFLLWVYVDKDVNLASADPEGKLKAPILGNGTYYIEIYTPSWNATYDLTCEFNAEELNLQNDADYGQDAPGEYSSAFDIEPDTTYSGSIGEELFDAQTFGIDQHDWYRLNNVTAGILNLNLEFVSDRPGGYIDLIVHNTSITDDNTNIFELQVTPENKRASGRIEVEEGDNYYLQITTFNARNVTYDFSFSINDTINDNPGDLRFPLSYPAYFGFSLMISLMVIIRITKKGDLINYLTN